MAEELLEREGISRRFAKVPLGDRVLGDPDEGDAERRRVDGEAAEGERVVQWSTLREHRCSHHRAFVPERSRRKEERLDFVLAEISK